MQGFDGDFALMRGFVGEHWFTRYVADGEDVLIVGALRGVGLDEATFVEFDFRVFQADAVTVGASAYGNEDAAESLRSVVGAIGVLQLDIDVVTLFAKTDDLCAEKN
jgi:hypothetical protein